MTTAGQEPAQEAAAASSGPQLGKRPKRRGGPRPLLVLGIAFASGIVLARILDWRGHAHPKD